MIELTRLNGTALYVNPDLIWLVEANPDTVIQFTHGEKLLVKESPATIAERMATVKRHVWPGPPPTA
jgi:flagellar protein FlbD